MSNTSVPPEELNPIQEALLCLAARSPIMGADKNFYSLVDYGYLTSDGKITNAGTMRFALLKFGS